MHFFVIYGPRVCWWTSCIQTAGRSSVGKPNNILVGSANNHKNADGFHAPLFSALTRGRLPEWASGALEIFVLSTQRDVIQLSQKTMRILYDIRELSMMVEAF